MKLLLDQRALCNNIIDNFSAQCTDDVLQLLPLNCTKTLQPMDLSVNKSVKDLLRNKFHQWYSNEVAAQDRGPVSPINLSLSVMKPLGATWLKKS